LLFLHRSTPATRRSRKHRSRWLRLRPWNQSHLPLAGHDRRPYRVHRRPDRRNPEALRASILASEDAPETAW